jgi:hypothetical protein
LSLVKSSFRPQRKEVVGGGCVRVFALWALGGRD